MTFTITIHRTGSCVYARLDNGNIKMGDLQAFVSPRTEVVHAH